MVLAPIQGESTTPGATHAGCCARTYGKLASSARSCAHPGPDGQPGSHGSFCHHPAQENPGRQTYSRATPT
jgi:hypothetical protein